MGPARRLASSVLLALGIAGAVAASGSGRARGPEACTPPAAAGVTATMGALKSGQDVWGDALLAAPDGPTYEAAVRLLPPLLYARGPGGVRLTDTGVYYLPFALPAGPAGAASVALHVADGSEILWRRVGGPSLDVFVGPGGGERYGSCLSRLAPAALAGGYLPILDTRYVDAAGVTYSQESFAGRRPGSAALVSFVRLTADARGASTGAVVRLAPSHGAPIAQPVARGKAETTYVAWTGGAPPARIDAAAYENARASVTQYWQQRLEEGMTVSVPEQRVENAMRALRIQEMVLTWRYSIGNAYEEFSFPEGPDVALVMAEQGFATVARSILETSLTRPTDRYPNWKRGERLQASASYYRLTRDRAYIAEATPVLKSYVAVLGRQIDGSKSGLLDAERYSSDIPDSVIGLHTQTVAWAGLRAMAGVWAETGHAALAATSRRLATRLEAGLRRAVHASEQRPADGSLFLPARLLDGEKPYGSLVEARLGSYWNLVVPYALSSGFFAPGGSEATGAWRYMTLHGSRLLGLVRAGAYALYGRSAPFPVSGTDEVYGNNVSRFLADNDRADQLVLSLYGELAAAMTRNTFVAGEGASIAPLDNQRYRSMYLPPNGASNGTFLETLRLMLVHETRDAAGEPHGLQLAYATPRAWLRPGKRIEVRRAPTSFGPVSFAIAAGTGSVRAVVDVPRRTAPKSVSLRLRLPHGLRLTRVTVGGKPWRRFDRASGTIDLSGLTGTIELTAAL